MKTIRVTDAAAQFIKQIREEGLRKGKFFFVKFIQKRLNTLWPMLNTVKRIFTR